MSQQWYANIDKKVRGPMTTAELKQLVEASQIQPETPLRLEKGGKWMRASRVNGLGFTREERTAMKLAEAKAIENAPENRRWVTPLTLFLTIIAMVVVLVMMFVIQFQRIKNRAEVRAEERKPVMETTSKIEFAAFDVKFSTRRNGGQLPQELSSSRVSSGDSSKDAWGRKMKIEPEGSPVSSYKILSAGSDGQFNTQDDIAIRFNMQHEQIERINTYGMEELQAEMDSAMASFGNADREEEEPSGRFTYSNGVVQILLERDIEYLTVHCESEEDAERLGEVMDNNNERWMDRVEEIDPRGKKPVPGGIFNAEQWAEVEEIANGISLSEIRPFYDSILREAGFDEEKP
jgi:hypothetical protein